MTGGNKQCNLQGKQTDVSMDFSMDEKMSPEGVVRTLKEKDQIIQGLESFHKLFKFYCKLVSYIVSKRGTIF